MIRGLRVDYRLLHGQVVFSYIANLGADCVLLASDVLMNDPIMLQTVKLTRPRNVKVVAKNVEDGIEAIKSGVTDKYKLLIICANIEEAYRVLKGVGYKTLNLGGCPSGKEKKNLAQAVNVSDEEISLLKELVNDGVYCYVQGSAGDKEVNIKDLI